MSGVVVALGVGLACAGEAVPLESVSIEVDVTGPLAELILRQTFRNVTDGVLDATYTFPLDTDAVVDGMVVTVGDRVVRSEVLPRDAARQVWEDAAQAGQVAVLTEQHRPNVFAQAVANLPPGEPIEVELRVVQPVDRADGAWEIVVPLAVAPRFVRPQDVGAPEMAALDVPFVPPAVVPAAFEAPVDPPVLPRADLAVALHATAPIHSLRSPSHTPRLVADGVEASAALDDVPLDRDFVLRWRTDGDLPQIGALRADGHAMVLLEVPQEVPAAERAPREIVWVLDTSGSMGGDKIALARDAMLGAFDTMDERDSFAVLGFGDEVRSPFSEAVAATPDHVQRARAFVRSLDAQGGTWMERALHVALALPPDPERRRMVVFVTDGQIGHDVALLGEIAQAADRATFVALGIGAAPNRYLLDEMARLGGGVVAYAERPEDLETLVGAMDRPALTDVRIDWGDCDPELVSPAAVPILRPGRPVHLLARVRGPCIERVRVVARGDRIAEFDLAVREVPRGRALASTFARERVGELERRAMRGVTEDPGAEIEAVGLAYGIVTSRTSMVAVDERVVDPSGQASPVSVPQALPYGEPLEQGLVQGIPAGRTYQSVHVTQLGGVGGNPNLAGGASNENTFLIDGASITDPVTGAFAAAWSHDRPSVPVQATRLPAGPSRFPRIDDELRATLRASGAGAGGAPLLGGQARGEVSGRVSPGVAADLRASVDQRALGEATVRRGSVGGRLDAAVAGLVLSAAGSAAPGAVLAGGTAVPTGTYAADLGLSGAGITLDGGWARRTLADGLRDRLDAELRVPVPLRTHQAALGVGAARTTWSAAGAPAAASVGGFVQDVWSPSASVALSGGLRVDALLAPAQVLPSPRLTAMLRPRGDDDTRLFLGWDVVRDLDRILPVGASPVRLPVDATLSVRGERQVAPPVRLALSAAWSRQRFGFTGAPRVVLLPADAPEVARDVASATAGLDLSPSPRVQLGLSYRFVRALQAADTDRLADPIAPFVPGYLAAYRPHAVTADLRLELPASLRIGARARWASAVPGDLGGWWTGDELLAALNVERRFGPMALSVEGTAARNDVAASIVPLEAYGAGVALPSIGEQPVVRAQLGLEVGF